MYQQFMPEKKKKKLLTLAIHLRPFTETFPLMKNSVPPSDTVANTAVPGHQAFFFWLDLSKFDSNRQRSTMWQLL